MKTAQALRAKELLCTWIEMDPPIEECEKELISIIIDCCSEQPGSLIDVLYRIYSFDSSLIMPLLFKRGVEQLKDHSKWWTRVLWDPATDPDMEREYQLWRTCSPSKFVYSLRLRVSCNDFAQVVTEAMLELGVL